MSNVEMFPQYDTKLMTDVWGQASDFLTDYQNAGIPTTISNQNATTLYYLLYAKYGNTPIANYDENQWKYKMFSIIFQYGPTWEKRLDIQTTLRGLQLSDLIDNGSYRALSSQSGSETSSKTGSDNNTRTLNTTEKNTGTSALANTGTDTTASTGTQSVARTGTVGTTGETEDIKNHAFNPSTSPAQNAYSPLNYINEQNATKNNANSTVTNNLTDTTTNDLENQTTHNTTSTTTNDLSRSDTGTITDARAITDSTSAENSSQNETTTVMTAGKLKAYEKLLELLETDVTGAFINKFKVCFKQFVMPERRMIYVTDLDKGDEQ